MAQTILTPLLTTSATAKIIGLSPRTLESLRVRGGGPAFVKLGRAVRYERDAIIAWIDARRAASTSDYDA